MNYSVKSILVCSIILFSFLTHAKENMKMNYKNEDLTKVIEDYSKASGKKFIVDPVVRVNVTILNPTEVSLSEAYNQLSTALAMNGYAIVKQDDIFVVRTTRSAERDNIEVVTEIPPANPRRMVTWITTLKNINVSNPDLIQRLKTVSATHGEIATFERSNQIIVIDWSTNLPLIADIITKADVVSAPTKRGR